MTFAVTNTLRHLARQARARMTRSGVILMYHRTAEVQTDPWGLCVSPRNFAEHLDVLRARSVPMQLNRFVSALDDRSLPRHAVALTFDDGYADNLHAAAPLLDRFDVPATVFLTTGYTRTGRLFWWDELERLLLQRETLPNMLRLTIDGETHEWDLSEATECGRSPARQHHTWRAWHEPPTPRHALFYDLWKQLYQSSKVERQHILRQVADWANASTERNDSPRPLSTEEVKALTQIDLIDIGAHTVSHPPLALFPPAVQSDEIQQSKLHLEDLLGRPVDGFSYPHGDFTEETASIVRRSGFAFACSTARAPVTAGIDRFQLPRFQVLDWDGDEFTKRLSAWRTGVDGR